MADHVYWTRILLGLLVSLHDGQAFVRKDLRFMGRKCICRRSHLGHDTYGSLALSSIHLDDLFERLIRLNRTTRSLGVIFQLFTTNF